MEPGLRPNECDECKRKRRKRVREAFELKQRSALELLHDHEGSAKAGAVALEQEGPRHQIFDIHELANYPMLARTFFVGISALVEAQHQRLPSRDLGMLSSSRELEFKAGRLPSARQNSEFWDFGAEI